MTSSSPGVAKEINLFCFPFAGGSKYSYHVYKALAPRFLNVLPLELPGRGARIREPLLTDLNAMIDDLYAQVAPNLGKPYAIYGHSMGALTAYLVTRRIIAAGYNKPLHLFLTGCSAPGAREYDQKRHLLPKDEFIAKLKEYGGSPDEVLQDDDLMNFFEPILRADFQGIEKYVYQETPPFDIPVTVMIGLNEPVKYEAALAWQHETTAFFELQQLPGKHFFIFEHPKTIMETIADGLQKKALFQH